MKNLLFGLFLIVLGISFTAGSYAQEKPKSEESTEVVTEESGVVNTVCPVSGEEIDPEITHSYNGKTYAVCCNSCLKKFKADPEKYISRLSEDGNSLKKKK